MRLAKKVAVITGGGSGIGRATVLRFLREGAKVVLADYNQETGEVYWWDKPEEVWTDNDELLVNTLLMWGELESTIDGGC